MITAVERAWQVTLSSWQRNELRVNERTLAVVCVVALPYCDNNNNDCSCLSTERANAGAESK